MPKNMFVLLLTLLAAACTATPPALNSLADLLTPAVPAVARPTPTATLVPMAVPTRDLAADPLRPAAIFQAVSPSVAFIDTDDGSGSAVLLADGFLLTNAHVVWPRQKVRVVFPDGIEIEDAPVYNWDLMADLALIGPLDVDEPALSLIDGEDLIIGSDVYLIGYPGEVEEFPQPTISRGLISRMRTWEPLNLTYFQSDATIAGGQSGGVLVSELGEVIGISGFSFANNEFALVASAADLAPLVQRMKEDTGHTTLIHSRMSTEKTSRAHEFSFSREPADLLLVYELGEEDVVSGSDPEEEEAKEIEFEVAFSGGGKVYVSTQRAFGYGLGYAALFNGQDETVRFVPREEGLYFVTIQRPENFDRDEATGTLTIRANVDLTPYREIEEGLETLNIGEYIAGFVDYEGDSDMYKVTLAAGDEIYLRVESILIDPYLRVDIPQLDMNYGDIPGDDDSGGGLFGYDAEMSYRAPQDGVYYITVSGGYSMMPGGYFLTLDRPAADAPTPMAPPPTATPMAGAFGDVRQYTSEGNIAYQIQVPADWSTTIRAEGFTGLCRAVTECYANPRNSIVLAIAEEDLGLVGFGDMDLDEYSKLIVDTMIEQGSGAELLSHDTRTNAQGYKVVELEATLQYNLLHVHRLIYIEDGVAFNATFVYGGRTDSEPFPAMTEEEKSGFNDLVRNVFDSFQIKTDGDE